MAGTKKSDLEVREQLKELTECCVCKETYKDPKILPCIHTFCMKCLEEAGGKTSKSPGDQMPCPMCRKEFTIPEEGYAALQKNFFMEKLIEMAKITSPSGGPDRCEACMEKESVSTSVSEVPLADMYCADCQKKLCQECSRHHRKNKLSRNHQVVSAVDSQSKVQILRPSNCEKHEREHLLYCSECKELLCISCFGESHQNHRLQDVGNVVEGFKNKIKDILSGLEVCECQVFGKKLILNCDVEEYCANVERLKLEVLAERDAIVKLVTEHSDLIVQDIDQLKVHKRKEVKAEIQDSEAALTCLDSFKVDCSKVMTKGSASDICCSIDELKETFEFFKKVHEFDIEVKTYFPKISFQVSDFTEFVKTGNYNIIGTIQECQTEVDGEDETKTISGKISHDGNKKMEDSCRMPISGNNGILAKCNHLKQERENAQCRICGLEMEDKALEKRINKLKLECSSIERRMKYTSELSMTAQTLCLDVFGGAGGANTDSSMGSPQMKPLSPMANPSYASMVGRKTPGDDGFPPVDSRFNPRYRPIWSLQSFMSPGSPAASPLIRSAENGTLPSFHRSSPAYMFTSPSVMLASRSYSPYSPDYSPGSPGSAIHSPTSPTHSPTSPK